MERRKERKMEKIRILAIAPYRGLKNVIEEIAPLRNDCIVTTYVGDLEEAKALFLEINQDDYDVVLSRGGTAELLQTVSRLPVLNIQFSYRDILSALNLAKPFNGKSAFIGYPSLTDTAEKLVKLLDIPFDFYTIRNRDDVVKVFESFGNTEYGQIICDNVSAMVSQEMGFNSILIISGKESIENALDEAVDVAQIRKKSQSTVKLLEKAISFYHNSLIIYDSDGVMLYCTDQLLRSNTIRKMTQALIPSLKKKGKLLSIRKVSGKN